MNKLITGSYGVGKTTVTQLLEKKIPPEERIVTYDIAWEPYDNLVEALAAVWLSLHNFK